MGGGAGAPKFGGLGGGLGGDYSEPSDEDSDDEEMPELDDIENESVITLLQICYTLLINIYYKPLEIQCVWS